MASEYDLTSDSFFNFPYPTYARMRREDPCHQDPQSGMYFVTRHRDVQAVTLDRRLSSARVDQFFVGLDPDLAEQMARVHRFYTPWLVFLDPPAHTRLRALVNRAFTPRRVAVLEDFTRSIVNDALDRVADQPQFDIITDLSVPVPARVISHMLGVPSEDVHAFKTWTEQVFRVLAWVGDQEENVRVAYDGACRLEEYFRGLIAQRRDTEVDDLLGVLVRANEQGRTLTEQELVSTCALILIAGHQTTTNQIGNAMLALLRHPAELARLKADPSLIDSAVEELLRYEAATGGIARVATEDIDVAGRRLPAGSVVMAVVQAANWDEDVFPSPERLDLGRPNNHHLTLGHGIHTCVGAALARMELRVAISILVDRLPEMSLPDQQFEWTKGFAERGLKNLVVRPM